MPLKIKINNYSSLPKYRQVIEAVMESIREKELEEGDMLPSVNQMIRKCHLSRDTVVKAYNELKKREVIKAIPNKGYYIRGNRQRILLFFDSYSSFKEGLYNSFRKGLPAGYEIDLIFHHYNIDVFESMIQNSIGKYDHWVIMSFDHPGVEAMLGKLDPSRVLVIDMYYRVPPNISFIRQDFNEAFYECLLAGYELFRKYKTIYFINPPATHHPAESAGAFLNYCRDNKIKGKVLDRLENHHIEKGSAYIVVSDNDMVHIVEKCFEKDWNPGKDIGIVSYNDTAVKKIIANGISVISTDFEEIGRKAALSILQKQPVREVMKTRLIKRSSL